MNLDPQDPAVIARRNAATEAFKERAHRAYHAVTKTPLCEDRRCKGYPR